DELLPPDQAFAFTAFAKDADTIEAAWQVADGYYLYREKIELSVAGGADVRLGEIIVPHGTPKHDEAFGQVEILRGALNVDVPVMRTDTAERSVTLTAKFQGCADRGVCYPPMTKSLELMLPGAVGLSSPDVTPISAKPVSEQDRIVGLLRHDTLWLTLLSFFGFGLLLAFTPCVFPMIPILSGIIVGSGKNITTFRAFSLSFSYVLASALTYTVFGILAAEFGSNLQATFQQPWVISLFSAVFVLLALSMFGFYTLELPKALQTKMHESSERHRDGSLWGAAAMGSFSSLIVGPCVAAPLAGALLYIGQTGDRWLGGSALFAMGLGMGTPLLLLGASAGKLLPKAGTWLNATKAVFGVVMLAVAVWMLERILPAPVTMFLWALLLIIPSVYLGAVDPLPEHAGGWRKLWKGTGVVMLIYGVLLLIGLGTGNHNPLKPLKNLGVASVATEEHALDFERIDSHAQLLSAVERSAAAGKIVMLDFYADWCISCKEMEAYTFSDPAVRSQLAQLALLKADVTANTAEHQSLLKKFGLVGPPAILFFGRDGLEKAGLRVIGYQDTEAFLQTLQHVRS
ncbi:MAG: protein-disulfide reductase DsbD, partial [Gammaproteobacteria bacterium]